jgi:general L-amino acid transport system permease protein
VATLGLLLLTSVTVPLMAFGLEEGIRRNTHGLISAAISLGGWIGSLYVSGSAIPWTALAFAIGAAVFSLGSVVREPSLTGRTAAYAWAGIVIGVMLAMLLLGANLGLVPVETSQWGGLLVTLVVSVTGIVASLPLGILLALGRRSQMPVVKLFSIIFIELWRGVPLITVLFFSSVMLPLFLPEGTSFDKLLRALIGVALFSAAYMAEVVRSGLQAIPKGQYEGAMALGLSFWQMMNKIILPQALKISIPNIVGNFISLFKDTTLVSIIGIFDLLGMVRAGLKDSNWAAPSSTPTGYFTLALMFWIFCFAMSRYSIYTERRLNTGHKR